MSLKPWKQVSEETLVKYKVFHVKKTRRISPRTGKDIGLFIVDTVDWVNIVAFTPARELIMVRQYRHGIEGFALEIPGGIVHEGEDSAVAAARELREETGYAAGEVQRLGCATPNPAFLTNRITTYLATDCELEGDLIQDQGEDIEPVLVPWDQVRQKVLDGEIDHALVLAGLYLHACRDGS